jgi:hypothetical protein
MGPSEAEGERDERAAESEFFGERVFCGVRLAG